MASSPHATRLPFEGPAWLSPRWVAALGLVWVPLALGGLFCLGERAWGAAPALLLAVAVAATAAEWALARWMTRATTRCEALAVALGAQAFIVGACGLVLGLCGVLPPDHVLDRGPMPVSFTSFHAAFYGVLVAIWQGILGGLVVRSKAAPALDLRDRIGIRLGLGIGAPAAVALAVGMTWSEPSPRAVTFWLVAAVVLPLLGAAAAACTRVARRRWVDAVDAGRVPGWRIVDEPARASRGIVPLVTRSPAAPRPARVRVLVHTRPAAEPFRDAERVEPVALVADEARAARR